MYVMKHSRVLSRIQDISRNSRRAPKRETFERYKLQERYQDTEGGLPFDILMLNRVSLG